MMNCPHEPKYALCNLIDGHGHIVEMGYIEDGARKTRICVVCREIPHLPPAELRAWGEREHLRFVEWWPKA